MIYCVNSFLDLYSIPIKWCRFTSITKTKFRKVYAYICEIKSLEKSMATETYCQKAEALLYPCSLISTSITQCM